MQLEHALAGAWGNKSLSSCKLLSQPENFPTGKKCVKALKEHRESVYITARAG